MQRQIIKLERERTRTLNNITLEQNYSSSPREKKKAMVILLKSKGKTINEISKETKLCKRTIINYVNEYNNKNRLIGGLSFIKKNKYKDSSLKIFNNANKNILLKEFKDNPPLSYKEASKRIKKLFNITISESATRVYLNKNKIYTKRSKRPFRNTDIILEKENDRI